MHQFKFLLFFLVFPSFIMAQGINIGVDWEIPPSSTEIAADLQSFKENGISFVQIEGIIDVSIIQQIADHNLELWVSSGLKYTRKSDKFNNEQFQDLITDPLYYYRSAPTPITRYTLLENPQIYSGFEDNLIPIIQQVRSLYSGSIDIKSNVVFDISELSELSNGLILIDHELDDFDVESIDYIYLTQTSLHDNPAYFLRDLWQHPELKDKDFILDSNLLKQLLESDSNVKTVLNEFSRDKNAVIALPPMILSETNNAVITIIILICISLFVAIFTTNASYQRSIMRYMTTHNFYVNDVMMKRIRISGAVPIAWFMTLIFGSLLTWITYISVMNPVSKDMLEYHYPIFSSILSSGTVSILLFGVVSLAIIQIISFTWLTLVSIRKIAASQIIQLFVVPQQLIVPITIIASLLYLNTSNPEIIATIYLIFVFIVFITFPLISLDIIGNTSGKKMLFILLGPIMYIAVWCALIYWVLTISPIGDTLRLIYQMI